VREERLRKDAESIFKAAVQAVDSAHSVTTHLVRRDNQLELADQTYDLSAFKNVYVIGAGKAAAAMAAAVEEILEENITVGIVNVKYSHTRPLKKIRCNEAGHPVPDESGLRGSQQIVELLRQTGANDLVICLISGGGSALLPYPAEGLTLDDEKNLTREMLRCGATIQEINALRKHVSRVKGGRLAQLVYPSSLLTLILSDVIGDDLGSIASGPTVPDRSTFDDCLEVVDRYAIRNTIPASVLVYLEKGARGEREETPKADDPVFQRTKNVIIASNRVALEAAAREADELGYNSLILSSSMEGETKEVAKVHAAVAREICQADKPIAKPACVISGGETTVTIQGQGLGGRNQEFVLSAIIEIDGLEDVVILSGGTDGTDGPTDAAGALGDGMTARRARSMSLDARKHLRNNDAYHFFEPLGDLLMTGPTFTNVMDLRLILVG
jgi:glycerate 2-kinase